MLCHSIYLRVVKVHLFNLGLPMKRYTFVLPSEIACSPSAQMPFISSIRIFCKDIHETLKYVDEFSELKNDEIQKELTSLSLSLSLSLSTCRSVDALWFSWKDVHVPVSLSFSLYLHLQKRFGPRSDPNGIQERMFRKFKKLCMR